MPIIDRVKARIETDLDDTELQSIIDEANNEVIQRYGPHADPTNPITEWLDGYREKIVLTRPIDMSKPIVITEYWTDMGYGESSYVLQPADYRIWEPYHQTIQRWYGGEAFTPRRSWPERVQVEYTPINDGNQREEVIIKLVILSMQFDGLAERKIGDFQGTPQDYYDRREQLLATLMPGRGLYMR